MMHPDIEIAPTCIRTIGRVRGQGEVGHEDLPRADAIYWGKWSGHEEGGI